MKIKLLVIALFASFSTASIAQTPTVIWKKCLGGSKVEIESTSGLGAKIAATKDGGTILVSASESNNGDLTVNKGEHDVWIVKQDANGIIQWQKSFGGSKEDGGVRVKQTFGDGYIVCGYTTSNDGDFNNASAFEYPDGFACKLDKNGAVEWIKTFSDSTSGELNDIIQTPDSGYLAVGGIDVSSSAINYDLFLVKLDSNGNKQWEKRYGGSGAENAVRIQQTPDGYIIGGYATSNDGDVSHNNGGRDIWIIKIDLNGNLQWQKSYGGSDQELVYDIAVLNDGYVLVGCTVSKDGDISYNHALPGITTNDAWIIKIGLTGDIKWQKCYGGTDFDNSTSIIKISANSFIIGGGSYSTDGDLTPLVEPTYSWIFEIDSIGNINWSSRYIGSPIVGLCKTNNNELISLALVDSTYHQPDFHGGYNDLFVTKLTSTLGINNLANNYKTSLSPNPMTDKLHISIAGAQSKSYTIEIYNAIGKRVLQQQNESSVFDVDTNELPAGAYTYTLATSNGVISRGKLVK